MSSLLHCFWASGEAETMAEGGRKTELLTLWQLGSREAEGGWRPMFQGHAPSGLLP